MGTALLGDPGAGGWFTAVETRASEALRVAAGWVSSLLIVAGVPYTAFGGLIALALAWTSRDLDPRVSAAWAAPILGAAVAYSSYYEAAGPAGEGGAWAVYLVGSIVGLSGFMLAEVSYLAEALDYGISVSMIRVSVAKAYYYARWLLLGAGLAMSPLVDVVAPFYLLGGLVGIAEHFVVRRGEASRL